MDRHSLWELLKDAATSPIVGLGGIVSTLVVVYWERLRRFYRERKKSREKNKLHLWNVLPWNFVPWKSRDEREALMIVEAINGTAFDFVGLKDTERLSARRLSRSRRIAEGINRSLSPSLRPDKAKLAWNSAALTHLKETQGFYIPPTCSMKESTNPRVASDGIPSLVRWIGEASAVSENQEAGRFWVFAPGRAGKSIFMNRLFLELIGAGKPDVRAENSSGDPLPIPMLAAAETLRPHLEQIEALKSADDAIGKFAIAWLENRNIQIPAHRKSPLEDSFKAALQNGDIILLLDGVDELRHQDLGDFTKKLLEGVKYWVASDRPGKAPLVTTHRSLFLEDVWTYDQIVMNLDRRLPDGGPMVHTRETVKQIIRELIDRHEQQQHEGTTDQEHHWLCEPDNLQAFVAQLNPEMTEREIRQFAESQPNLFRAIFEKSVSHLGTDADLGQISERLFDLAVTDPTSPRTGSRPPTAPSSDRINDQVAQLTQITQTTSKGMAFRHAAMREYFLAGRIARDIVDPAVRTDNTDELARNELWDSSMREAIRSWLPHPIGTKTISRVRSRLKHRGEKGSNINPAMRRNLLDLLRAIDSRSALEDLDLSQIPGEGIDLKAATFKNCSLCKARLRSADLAGAKFSRCDFSGADLSGANAIGTRFENCTFESDGDVVRMNGMSIGADPANGDKTLIQERQTLMRYGAVEYRSRYRDEFADIWTQFQQVALGPGFVRLEDSVYLPAIKDAVVNAGSNSVYAVDIMAGGSYDRVTNLLREHANLHMLGIDKDPFKYTKPDRFEWHQLQLGKANGAEPDSLGLDLRALLTDKLGRSAYPPQLIVGKKALHEIDRSLQPVLIERCAESLAENGRLILFVDAPGPTAEEDLDRPILGAIQSRLAARRKFLAGDPAPSAVRADLQQLSFDGSPTSQIEFVNTWIMLKDWVNENWTEVSNRYFASIAEIKEWTTPSLRDCSTTTDAYRLNPLIFNELGILSVLHHIAEEKPDERLDAIRRDRRKLQGMIGESERLDVLVDFSCDHLADGSPLGVALKAEEQPINLEMLDPMLASLDTARKAWTFELTCAVLVFEKGRASAASAP